ncbi:hypothetical protein CYLTODRAFT_495226 [Cylindrobasidium torrendii FP15055 ss-10]|uniref:Helicase C-terminal domain-containing protein n=1 Tax=Cylindrobasidium torrendii FP15055 ss-10 TaxID=1314674 RepID=A0A0D7AU17_9AGAR|nr:hypothetical protein CYLTODRAFT_495226 [Cylindrobasidium torrendii FP15055 ss-10]
MGCPSCASSNHSAKSSHRLKIVPPFERLPLIGSLRLARLPVEVAYPCLNCTILSSRQGWHSIITSNYLSHIVQADELDLEFLLKDSFITLEADFRNQSEVLLAVYMVPRDLPGYRGQVPRGEYNKPPNLRARQALRTLIERVEDGVIPCGVDNRSLAEIYGDLPSPYTPIDPNELSSRFLDATDDLEGIGLRTELYWYQRETIASLIMKEKSCADIDNPLYLRLTSRNGNVFYYQPGTMTFRLEKPVTSPAAGGILCEELGTGKTVMTLGLILGTRLSLSSPESPLGVDVPTVYSPTSMTKFSGQVYDAQRQVLLNREEIYRPRLPCPTLSDLLIHRAATHPDQVYSAPADERILALLERRANQFVRNQPFYYTPSAVPSYNSRELRSASTARPRKMFLTPATLILVPVNLMSQWDREIHKHSSYPLRVGMFRMGDKLPDARELASEYDIVLMTVPRFAHEHSRLKSKSPGSCNCPAFDAGEPVQASLRVRVPDCVCVHNGTSPLGQIRWKRLVVDEGHIAATVRTSTTSLVAALSVQYRWIVTGTPTTNLLGLGFGSSSEQKPTSSETDPETMEAEFLQGNEQRIWTQHDAEDLKRLGNMITGFLRFRLGDESLTFEHAVAAALEDLKGPAPGAIHVLTQVMHSAMLRHRVEDVERDVILPALKHESVFLALEPMARKSYNALLASIAINAIDSERVDEDYLFHTSNTELLREVLVNMSQTLFWATDPDLMYNIPAILDMEEDTRAKAKTRLLSQDDLDLMNLAYAACRMAKQDNVWQSLQEHDRLRVPYTITNIDKDVFCDWSRTSGASREFIHGDRLLAFQQAIKRTPLVTKEKLSKIAGTLAEIDWNNAQIARDAEIKRDMKDKKKNHMYDNAEKLAIPKDMLTNMHEELVNALKRLEMLESEDRPGVEGERGAASLRAELTNSILAKSPYRDVTVGNSCSSKLNYIIEEVLQYAQDEKFLIFSETPLALNLVGEALDLLGIKYLRFTTAVKVRQREEMVLTFETSQVYRVFLMELKHGARGLNLVSASRVIFCEPVWEADVESQAIKRVHRIGQTRPVTVKTLAIKDTAEEAMIHRRKALQQSQSSTEGKIPRLWEDAGFRSYVAHPKFLSEHISDEHEQPNVNFKLFNIPLSADAQQDVDVELDEYATSTSPRSVEDSDGDYTPVQQVPATPVTPARTMKRARVALDDGPRKKHATVRFEEDAPGSE